MKVLFVADDFGLNSGINAAIVHTHVSGALHAAALMMAQPGTDEAVALARAHPRLQIGWHLHLNDSQPATREAWPWGASPAQAGIMLGTTRRAQDLLRREVARQWELFQATGLPCHFVNCHHHLQAHPFIFRALREVLGAKFPGWVRLGRILFFPGKRPPFLHEARLVDFFFQRARKLSTWRSADTLWGLDRLFTMKAPEVRAVISALPEGLHEFLFHPRTLTCPDSQCLLELKSLRLD